MKLRNSQKKYSVLLRILFDRKIVRCHSNEFSLLLGYFSSSAINLLSVGFATFICKGGKMKMVINHLLSAKDKEAISRVEGNTNEIRVFDLTDIVSLGRVLDEYDTHFFECLAYLISEKRIEIRYLYNYKGPFVKEFMLHLHGNLKYILTQHAL